MRIPTSRRTHPAVDAAAAFDRLTCLAHLQRANARIGLWHHADGQAREGIEVTFDRLRQPLVDGFLPSTMKERRVAGKFVEMWTEVNRLDAIWRAEAAGLLGWAIGLRETIGPFDRQTADVALLEAVVDPASFCALRVRAAWRPIPELQAAKTECDRWWQRARLARVLYAALELPTSTLSEKKQPVLRSELREPVVLFGKPYERLDFQEHSTVYSIAVERYTAILPLPNQHG